MIPDRQNAAGVALLPPTSLALPVSLQQKSRKMKGSGSRMGHYDAIPSLPGVTGTPLPLRPRKTFTTAQQLSIDFQRVSSQSTTAREETEIMQSSLHIHPKLSSGSREGTPEHFAEQNKAQ